MVNANTTPPQAVKQFPLIDTHTVTNTKSLIVDVEFKYFLFSSSSSLFPHESISKHARSSFLLFFLSFSLLFFFHLLHYFHYDPPLSILILCSFHCFLYKRDDSGSQFVSLSCACWIINNTLIPLCYQPSLYNGDDNFAPGFGNTPLFTFLYHFFPTILPKLKK